MVDSRAPQKLLKVSCEYKQPSAVNQSVNTLCVNYELSEGVLNFEELLWLGGGVEQLSPLSSSEEKHGFLVHVTVEGKTLLVSVVFLQIKQN